MAEKQKELGGPRKMSMGTKVATAVFAVVMALSMTLPSLAPIFAGNGSSGEQQSDSAADSQTESTTQTEDTTQAEETTPAENAAQTEDAAEDAGAEDGAEAEDEAEATEEAGDAAAGVPENETLKNLADENKDEVAKFEDRLKQDPKNLAALLNLGQDYMSWGYSALTSSTTDEEKEYSKGLINKAVEYYNSYLGERDSDAVKIQLALCDYYLGNTEQAEDALKKMTEEKPDYALAWANLGMLYDQQYKQDDAIAAYQKAAETDPDDEYGAKSYGEQRIDSINSMRSDFSALTNEELLGTKSKPEEGLPAIIANNSDLK